MNQIGPYKIIKKIGSGATAAVYLAEGQATKKRMAIKLLNETLSDDAEMRERFEREIMMLGRLKHPAIVPVVARGEENGRLYTVMPYLSGGSVHDKLKDGPLPLAESIRILAQIAPAVDEAHAHGVLHRDIKPSNILLDEAGNAYLADFGIARLMDQDGEAQTMTFVGTPEFMAPEQINQTTLVPQTDVYQLGVTLFKMLTAEYPYKGSLARILLDQTNMPIPSVVEKNPGFPAAIDLVVSRAMATEVGERFETAASLVEALKAAAKGELTMVVTPMLDLVWPKNGKSEPVSGVSVQPEGQMAGWTPVVMAFASLVLVLLVGLFLVGAQEGDLVQESITDVNQTVTIDQVDELDAADEALMSVEEVPVVEQEIAEMVEVEVADEPVVVPGVDAVIDEDDGVETAVSPTNTNDDNDNNNRDTNSPPPANGDGNRGNGGRGNNPPPRNGGNNPPQRP